MRDVGVQGGDINGDKEDIGGKGSGEEAEDGKEMVRVFYVRRQGLEVGVYKSKNLLSDRVMGSDNGAAGVIGFVDFREETMGGDLGI